MRNKKSKKGFTLVELLVVIAILAVLATVSVVGYMSFTKKAQISNDESLVAQLNIALKADEAVEGKPATPSAMLERMEEEGFNVEKLTPTTSKYNIVWNQEENQFALLDEKDQLVYGNAEVSEATAYKTWKFLTTKEYIEGTNFSVYLKGTDATGSYNVKSGFDAGLNTNITSVNYVNTADAKNVILRTLGETLFINAEKDTVSHYGTSDKVTVEAVAMNSYHEYGEVVGDLEVKKGRVEVTDEGKVGTVLVSSAAEGDVKVEVETGAEIGTVAPTTDAAKKDIEASTTIPADSKKEDIVEINTDFAGGLGTEKSPYLVSNLEQLRNVDKLGTSKAFYIKQTKDITIEGDASEYYNQSKDYSVIYKFNGSYDGNGFSITNKVEISGGTSWHSLFYNVYANTEIKNLNIYLGNTWFNLVSVGNNCSLLSFENINFYNQNNTTFDIPGNNYGLLISYTYHSKIFANNINNYANINNTEFNSGIFIGAWFLTRETKFVNCNNYGNWNGSCGFLNGNLAYVNQYNGNYNNLIVENCHNYGTIVGAKVNLLGKDLQPAAEAKEAELKNTNNFNGMYTMNATQGIAKKATDGKIELTSITGATKYVVTLYLHYTGKNSINGGFVLTKTYEESGMTDFHAVKFIDSVTALENENLGLADYKKGTKSHDENNDMDYYLVEANGILYYVFESPKTIEGDAMVLNGYPRCTVMVYNEEQLIAYEIVNTNNIVNK